MTPSELVREALRSIQGVPAIIKRGDTLSRPIKVILGRVDAIVTAEKSVRLEAKAQDILVKASDYKPTGEVSEPMANDRIIATINGKIVDFDVRPPSSSQKCFEFSNPEGTELRIHTKRVTSGA